jgi:hypothetical protein
VKLYGRALLLFLTAASMQVRTEQSSQGTLLLRIEPECSITRPASTIARVEGDGTIGGVTTFGYKLRTSKAGGASIQLRMDRPGGQLSYVVRLPGVPASAGNQRIPESSAMTVARFGPDAHSSREGDTGSVTWSLQDPARTGTPQVGVSIRCY